MTQLGKELEVVKERSLALDQMTAYERAALFENVPIPGLISEDQYSIS